MTSFEGKVYLATLKGLYVFDGTQVVPVDTYPPRDPRLSSRRRPDVNTVRADARAPRELRVTPQPLCQRSRARES